MKKDDFLPFFDLQTVNFQTKVSLAFNHLFHQFPARVGLANDRLLHQNASNKSRLLIGDLPLKSSHAHFLGYLPPNSLVVSCCNNAELSGLGHLFDAIPPVMWHESGIDHVHLPVDNQDFFNSTLALLTIQRMQEAYKQGRTIYVHSQADHLKSSILAVVFYCITYQKQFIDAQDIQRAVEKTINLFQTQQPTFNLSKLAINKATHLIHIYNLEQKQKRYSAIGEIEFITQLTQVVEFKALWAFAYQYPAYFEEVRTLLLELFNNTDTTIGILTNNAKEEEEFTLIEINVNFETAVKKINEHPVGQKILNDLKKFLGNPQAENNNQQTIIKTHEAFNQELEKYTGNPYVIEAARQLQSAVIQAQAPIASKISWLNQTIAFLKNPNDEAQNYWNLAQNALQNNHETLQTIGKILMYFSMIVLVITLVAAAAVGLAPMVVLIAAGIELAAIAVGYALVKTAQPDEVTPRSEALYHELV